MSKPTLGISQPLRKQLITIDAEGVIETLFTPDGILLSSVGEVSSVMRASEIEWSRRYQKWTVCFSKGKFAGETLNGQHYTEVFGARYPTKILEHRGQVCDKRSPTIYFSCYQDAIDAEIDILQSLTLKEGQRLSKQAARAAQSPPSNP